jgi:hypothetical protein
MKTFIVSIDQSHITNGCEFTEIESAELSFDADLLIQLRKGIEAAKALRATGVNAEIRMRYAEPETKIEDFDDSYSYEFEYAIVDVTDSMVFWYTIGENYGNWFEFIVDIEKFEEMEKALLTE